MIPRSLRIPGITLPVTTLAGVRALVAMGTTEPAILREADIYVEFAQPLDTYLADSGGGLWTYTDEVIYFPYAGCPSKHLPAEPGGI